MIERYAIYATFDGALGARGAQWLGWDIATGTTTTQPSFDGLDLDHATSRPRPYGFHATLKAPFRLMQGRSEADLVAAVSSICADLRPATCEGLALSEIGRFLALTLLGDDRDIKALARTVVQTLEPFRAPLTKQEIEKRNPDRLTDEQRYNLQTWGYPHVMDAFRFHVTLTRPLKPAQKASATAAAQSHFAHVLPKPFTLSQLTLVGQKDDGLFYEVLRKPLLG